MTDHPIGTKFKTRGKCPHECTVTDIHKTYNHAGNLVSTRYVASHKFMGQTVVEHEISTTSIAMGKIVE